MGGYTEPLLGRPWGWGRPRTELTLVYDDECTVCRRCQEWLSGQRLRTPMRFLGSSDPAATHWLGQIPGFKDRIMVVAGDGRVWFDDDAVAVALWATWDWRWAADGASGTVARWIFSNLASRRHAIGAMLDRRNRCADGSCTPPQMPPWALAPGVAPRPTENHGAISPIEGG